MEVNEFKGIVDAFWKRCSTQGKATVGVIQSGNTVLVEGRTLPFDVAVPIKCSIGKRVYCHIDGNKAVIIGM